MSHTTTPTYKITQTDSHIYIHVAQPSPAPSEPARAVAQGTTFGLVWGEAYLPLVLPAAASVAQGVDPVCQADDKGITVVLQKERNGVVAGLEELQPQILPDAPPAAAGSTTHDQTQDSAASGMLDAVLGRENERRVERGEGRIVEVQDSAATRDGDEAAPSAAYAQHLVAPLVREGTNTQVHEVFVGAVSDASTSEADNQKRRLRVEQIEEDGWDEGWYLENYADEEAEVASLLRWRAPWTSTPTPAPPTASPSLSPTTTQLLLLELLFSTLYDTRTTLGDATVESAWTISALSRSLISSSLPLHAGGVKGTLRESYRRALTRPLYRSWDLNSAVARDMEEVLLRGRQSTTDVIKGALGLLEESSDEGMKVYVKDTVGPLSEWLKSSEEASDSNLALLSQEVQNARKSLTRFDVGGASWDLDALEQAAAEVMAEGMDDD